MFKEKHKAVVLNDRIKRRKETTIFSCMNLLPLSEILGSFVFVVRFLYSFINFLLFTLPSLMTLTESRLQLKEKGLLVRVNNSARHDCVL